MPRTRLKSGAEILRVFGPVAQALRQSVVKLDVDGNTMALATVVDASGLAITKASEIQSGRLTAWVAGGREVPVELLAVDEASDVALIRIQARGLKPVAWAMDEVIVGQWAITPGTEETPQAVGIVSVLPRKILPRRALIGVQLDFTTPAARVAQVMTGMGAEKAGLRSGDVILAVNEVPVAGREELVKLLREYREGQTVTLRLQRDQKEMNVPVPMMSADSGRSGRGSGGGNPTDRLGGRPSQRAEGFELALQHDTVLQPWQCGGPLVNPEGKVIGLNIARAGRVATYALPAGLVRRILGELAGNPARSQPAKPVRPTSRSTGAKTVW